MRKALLQKIPLCLTGIFLFFQSNVAQEVNESVTIEWQEDRLLNWSDYRFRTLASNRQIALTSVKHSVRGYMRQGVPDFEVKVVFVAKDSWTSDTTTVGLLGHEQLHFDIGELYRRKIVKRINGLREKGEKQKAIYRYVIKKLLSDFRNFSREYDEATRFGNRKDEQEKWKNKVWEELKRLK